MECSTALITLTNDDMNAKAKVQLLGKLFTKVCLSSDLKHRQKTKAGYQSLL
ncbi:mCG1035661 [Mus musculus]|nr:mCG1035661 [Mus musculus]